MLRSLRSLRSSLVAGTRDVTGMGAMRTMPRLAQTVPRARFSSEAKPAKHFPESGVAYMDGIRNFNKEVEHAAFKPSEPITIAAAKKAGFEVHTPVREYYTPGHWKAGKSHLLLSLEFDMLHVWARPPDGKAFPASPLLALSEDEARAKWPYFVPAMQKLTTFDDDWVITDVHTLWAKTPIWVVPAFERFLGVRLHQEGTPEYDALVTDLDGQPLTEDPGGWVGPEHFARAVGAEAEADTSDSSDSDSDTEVDENTLKDMDKV